ncbi:MAG: chemotaxis protein CheW [Candidatus Methylomirabilia bacterium]
MADSRGAGPGDELRLLFFRSAGERFALDVAYVREIILQQPVTPVPFVPPTVAGIINHRGMIYTLIRFARFAGLGKDREGAVVLLRLPEMAVGLAVEAVEGIEQVSGRLLHDTTKGTQPAIVPFLRRACDPSGKLVHLVDAELLVDTIYRLPDPAHAGEPAREAVGNE